MWRSAVQVCLGLLVSQVISYLSPLTSYLYFGGLAQLARAPALQAGGQRFESVILHVMENGRIKEWKNWSLQSFNFSIFQFFTEIFDILTHKTVSKDFKLLTECFLTTLNLQLKVWARSSVFHIWVIYNGERKLGRLVDALALGGDEGRDKLR